MHPHPACLLAHCGLSHMPFIALATRRMYLPGPDTCSTERAPQSGRRTAGRGAGAHQHRQPHGPPPPAHRPLPGLSMCVKRHDTDRLGPGGGHALTVPACEQTLGRPHDGPPPRRATPAAVPEAGPRGCWKASLHRSDPSHCKTCSSVRLRAGHGDSLTGEPPLLDDGCSRLGGTAPAQGLRVAQASRGPSCRASQDSPVTAASGEHLRAVTRALSGDGGRSHGSQNPSEISVFSRIH